MGLLAATPALAQTPTIYGLGTPSRAIAPEHQPAVPRRGPAGSSRHFDH
ncbi:MAG: hypothetical protein WKG07_11815 [Hymenobacter sp.]